jgi:hypothetical protein
LDKFLGWMVMTLAVLPGLIVLLLARSAPKRRNSPRDYAPDALTSIAAPGHLEQFDH